MRLRLLVAAALAEAKDWPTLRSALRKRALQYEPAGGGLILADVATGRHLARSSQICPACLALVWRFGIGFPGHPLPGPAIRALAQP